MPKSADSALRGRSTGDYRVLLIDDDREAVDGLARLLDLHGFKVRGTCDGQSALTLARQFQPQAIVLDIDLPKMNGYELVKQLRALPESANALVVAVTGYGQEQDRARSRAAGFDHHLVKPIEPAALVQLLQANDRSA